jgi:5-methyltetrahydrofolate--homocysteine methyltransferase
MRLTDDRGAGALEPQREPLFQALVSGDRAECRRIVAQSLAAGHTAEDLTRELYWPLLETVTSLYRQDQLATISHQYAVRLLRSLVDQAQARYEQKPARNRTICLFCGQTEADDLAGQLVADLAESDGYQVFFGGGGVANDEILAEVNQRQPDILMLFSSGPRDAPAIRTLIDTIRSINACPNLQIVVGGGIFNRAPGLAEEIGADLSATSPQALLDLVTEMPQARNEAAIARLGSKPRKLRDVA